MIFCSLQSDECKGFAVTRFKRNVAMACVLLSSCASQNSAPVPLPPPQVQTPRFSDTTTVPAAGHGFGKPSAIILSSGQSVGTLRVAPWPNSVALGLVATGLTPGTYHVRVHEIGRCDPPAFTSAGGRWKGGTGDLGPKTVDANGRLYVTTLLHGAKVQASDAGSVPSLLDSDGASILVYPEQSVGSKPLACAVVAYP